MRRVVLMAVLALAMPVAAFANSIAGPLRGSSGLFTYSTGTFTVALSGDGRKVFNIASGSVTGTNFAVSAFSNGGLTDIVIGKTVSGDTIVAPEPGTLGLLGTGLVGIAALVRRKLKVR